MRIATFNIRGIKEERAKNNLEYDCQKYHLDIVALEETKSPSTEWTSKNGFYFHILEHKKSHYGQGFAFRPRYKNSVEKIRYVTDRICVSEMNNFEKTKTKLITINVYLPTSQINQKRWKIKQGCHI